MNMTWNEFIYQGKTVVDATIKNKTIQLSAVKHVG